MGRKEGNYLSGGSLELAQMLGEIIMFYEPAFSPPEAFNLIMKLMNRGIRISEKKSTGRNNNKRKSFSRL